VLTWFRGKISAMSFLYLLTGCLDLALIAGQKKQRLPHAGITCLETKPEIALILDSKYISLNFFCFLSPLNRTETQDFGNKKGKKDSKLNWVPSNSMASLCWKIKNFTKGILKGEKNTQNFTIQNNFGQDNVEFRFKKRRYGDRKTESKSYN